MMKKNMNIMAMEVMAIMEEESMEENMENLVEEDGMILGIITVEMNMEMKELAITLEEI